MCTWIEGNSGIQRWMGGRSPFRWKTSLHALAHQTKPPYQGIQQAINSHRVQDHTPHDEEGKFIDGHFSPESVQDEKSNCKRYNEYSVRDVFIHVDPASRVLRISYINPSPQQVEAMACEKA